MGLSNARLGKQGAEISFEASDKVGRLRVVGEALGAREKVLDRLILSSLSVKIGGVELDLRLGRPSIDEDVRRLGGLGGVLVFPLSTRGPPFAVEIEWR